MVTIFKVSPLGRGDLHIDQQDITIAPTIEEAGRAQHLTDENFYDIDNALRLALKYDDRGLRYSPGTVRPRWSVIAKHLSGISQANTVHIAVANLPAEITHLMEEIQAKDKIIQECRTTINSRDNSIQKFIKLNGSLTPNPKEEQYSKTILQNLDRCQTLQDEKIQLSEKACVLLDRQIKKLDVKVRDLVSEGILSNEPPLPSLFNNKEQYGELPKVFFPDPTPTETPISYTPLNPTSGNASTPTPAAQRLNQTNPRVASAAPLSTQTPVRNSAPSTPTAAALHLQQRQRESSAGAVDSKRRRLNASLGTLPAAPSNLRQSSLGPGTPKAGTPKAGTPVASRAGSAGPRAGGITKKALTKKVAPHQQLKKIKSGLNGKPIKRSSSVGGRIKTLKNSPSAAGGDEEDEDSILSSADGSESENAIATRRAEHGPVADSDEEMEDEEEEGAEDSKVYCTCRSVSHGDMVACDNDSCPYEWFHWKCVGLTREPLGTWYCDECRQTLGK
jgi:inhibitor of growth protein 3